MTHLDPDPRYVPEPLTQADILVARTVEAHRNRGARVAGLVLVVLSVAVVVGAVAFGLGWRP